MWPAAVRRPAAQSGRPERADRRLERLKNKRSGKAVGSGMDEAIYLWALKGGLSDIRTGDAG